MARCDRADCTNEGTHRPVLLFNPVGYPESPPAEFVIGLRVCAKHQENATAKDFLSDEGWEQIDQVFRAVHRVLPDHERVGLVFKRYTPFDRP